MDFLRGIFSPKDEGVVCPRCDKAIVGHDEAACSRRLSRRFFFGAMAGGLVVATSPELILSPLSKRAKIEMVLERSGNTFLTIPEIAYAMLPILHNNIEAALKVSRGYGSAFNPVVDIATQFGIRKPRNFAEVA
jgi:hypothetical protein